MVLQTSLYNSNIKTMASINLIEAFQEFKDAENIDRPTLMKVVEDVFKTLLRKNLRATKILMLL